MMERIGCGMTSAKKRVRKAVKRGVKYLDKTYPDWTERVDVLVLNINDGCRCPLGQLNGSFFRSPEWRIHSDKWLTRRGFIGRADTVAEWSELTAEWKRVIRRRQSLTRVIRRRQSLTLEDCGNLFAWCYNR